MDQNLEGQLTEFAEKIKEKMDNVAKQENALKNEKDELQGLKNQLAEFADNNGIEIGSKITLKNGLQVIVKEFWTASIPTQTNINKEKDPMRQVELQERRDNCFAWIDENNLGDVIKNKIVASFDKGQEEVATEILVDLQSRGILAVKEASIHPSTLKATLKEQVGDGVEVPFETFGIQTGVVVDIKG